MSVKSYELIVIFPSGEREAGQKALKDIFRRHSVVVLRSTEWGEKPLPHPIQKHEYGYFLYQDCNIKPSALEDLRSDIELSPQILRLMLKRASAAPR